MTIETIEAIIERLRSDVAYWHRRASVRPSKYNRDTLTQKEQDLELWTIRLKNVSNNLDI